MKSVNGSCQDQFGGECRAGCQIVETSITTVPATAVSTVGGDTDTAIVPATTAPTIGGNIDTATVPATTAPTVGGDTDTTMASATAVSSVGNTATVPNCRHQVFVAIPILWMWRPC